jgi:hypothetical protein
MRRVAILLALVAGCDNGAVNGSTSAAACATATACGIIAGGISACTSGALRTNDPSVAAALHISTSTVSCIAAAGSSCDAARKCLDGGMTPSPCTGTSGSCTGTVLTTCSTNAGVGGNKGTAQFNCGDVGLMCVVANGNADCGSGSCAGLTMSCVGNKVQSCANSIIREVDCTRYGATCVAGALGGAHCRGTGASCTGGIGGGVGTGTPLRCDGSVLVTCLDSQEARTDCAATQQQCLPVQRNGTTTFACVLGSACDPNAFSATCAGNKLSYCNDGALATYDCGANGFHGCSPGTDGKCVP